MAKKEKTLRKFNNIIQGMMNVLFFVCMVFVSIGLTVIMAIWELFEKGWKYEE